MIVDYDPISGEAGGMDLKTTPKCPYTHGEETRLVDVIIYQNGKKILSEEWDDTLLIESSSDMSSLFGTEYASKRILVVKLRDWKRGRIVDITHTLKCFVCGKTTCRGECDEDTFLGLIL
jgi:hypothetical protein